MPGNARAVLRTLAALLLGLALLGSACSSTPELPADVVDAFDVANNALADLTGGTAPGVDSGALLDASARASAAGTDLRIAIAGAGQELVSAEAIVERYGGTALTYQVDDRGFEAASKTMSGDQLDRAIRAAGAEPQIADSAVAFVEVIEAEGVEAPGRSIGRTIVLVLLALAALFALTQAWNWIKADRRRKRRQRQMEERRNSLRSWANAVVDEVDYVATRHHELDAPGQSALRESHSFMSTVGASIDGAERLSDLDAAEIRLARHAMILRDLRATLS